VKKKKGALAFGDQKKREVLTRRKGRMQNRTGLGEPELAFIIHEGKVRGAFQTKTARGRGKSQKRGNLVGKRKRKRPSCGLKTRNTKKNGQNGKLDPRNKGFDRP